MAAPSSSTMVRPMPPNGHSTANSKVSPGGSGHSHSPKCLKLTSSPLRRVPPLLPGDQDSSGPAADHPKSVSCAGAARWWWPSCHRRSARPAATACPAAGGPRAFQESRHTPTCASSTSRPRATCPAWRRPPRRACSQGGKPGSWASAPPRSRCGLRSGQRRAPRPLPARAARTTAAVPAIRREPAPPRPAGARRT
jgi:hypothetical protein